MIFWNSISAKCIQTQITYSTKRIFISLNPAGLIFCVQFYTNVPNEIKDGVIC